VREQVRENGEEIQYGKFYSDPKYDHQEDIGAPPKLAE
jgi:hypothetical protein